MNNKKEIFGWAMFDFANSAYTTNIVTVIFVNYFVQGIVPEGSPGKTLWGGGIFVSNLLIILSAPIIGAVGDFSGSRKKLLITTCLCCVIGTAGLFLATPGAVVLALILFVISNYFFQISESLCSSFLPNLAEPSQLGKISGFGWALGYIGGLVGLVLCLPFVGDDFGPDNQFNMRLTNIITAAAFLIAAIPTFLFLKEHGAIQKLPPGATYVSVGFGRVKETLTHLRKLRDLALFLFVFFIMAIPLTTLFAYSTLYATEEMGFTPKDLMALFIILQLSAAIGALSFGFVQDRLGLKFSIQTLLIFWFGLLVTIYFVHSVSAFKGLAVLLGAGLGAIQSGARALIGYMAPKSKAGEIFGFWSLTYKFGGLIGPLAYGLISDNISHRIAMLFIAVFFLIAFLVNLAVDQKRGHSSALEFEREFGDSAGTVE
ncbi:MAG: MFS transporter [Candidatus Omnitrophica bacterium]|nr:MFS transporter [Candidatus Omnitrophota bacterium]